jgi:hypothetical protein
MVQTRVQAIIRELRAPSALEAMSANERATVAATVRDMPKYVIQCHGGVSLDAFRVPPGNILCMIVPVGRMGVNSEFCSLERKMGEGHTRLLTRGILEPRVLPSEVYGQYVRVYLPGEWAPDARLYFGDLKLTGIFKLADVAKPWRSVFDTPVVDRLIESRNILQLRDNRATLSELMFGPLCGTPGVFFGGWCRYPRTLEKSRFQWLLEKPTRTSSRSYAEAICNPMSRMHLADKNGSFVRDATGPELRAHALFTRAMRSRDKNDVVKEARRLHPYKRPEYVQASRYFEPPDGFQSLLDPAMNNTGVALPHVFREIDGGHTTLTTTQLY